MVLNTPLATERAEFLTHPRYYLEEIVAKKLSSASIKLYETVRFHDTDCAKKRRNSLPQLNG